MVVPSVQLIRLRPIVLAAIDIDPVFQKSATCLYPAIAASDARSGELTKLPASMPSAFGLKAPRIW
ncbi:MAG: hypothetical protein ACK5M4_12540 [Pseudorhodobacter sp.]